MILKWILDRLVSLIGLLVLWPVLVVIAILVRAKMPGGPVIFKQKRVGHHRIGKRREAYYSLGSQVEEIQVG